MRNVKEELDTIEHRVLSELKDFQLATVNRIYDLFESHHDRVLVSDEVGLGKTLVARGVVARFAQLRKSEGDDLVKVVYICSNSAIAEQNLNKLRVSNEVTTERADSSRLSMQHLNIFNQENDQRLKAGYIQLIPLTPETSFRMTAGAGTANERALMFALLRRMEPLKPYEHELEDMLREQAPVAWDYYGYKDYYEQEAVNCNDRSNGEYFKYMMELLSEELNCFSDKKSLLSTLIQYLDALKNSETPLYRSRDIIAKLRVAFAKVSIDRLQPDIVIMDEFQRFRFLLNADPESDIGLLVSKFFNTEKLRILLLSATPYKMYSTLEEIDETHIDEHYSEFLDVMKFLKSDNDSFDAFKTTWSNYSICLRELAEGDTAIIQAKRSAEEAMYESVCRTERMAGNETADMIDDSSVRSSLDILDEDVKSYIQMQSLLKDIGAPFNTPIDYVKSCPYLMSFMNNYQLKRKIEKYYSDNPEDVNQANRDTLWIKRQRINKYEKLASDNARLNRLMQKSLPTGAEKLLWIPPSKPYYEMGSPFRDFTDFSKTIVFSSWEMVPRMIASLVSYEAERLTVGSILRTRTNNEVHYFHNEKKRYPPSRYSFALSEGSPRRMTLFSLLYPSDSLVDLFDPIDCLNRSLTLRQIEREIQYGIRGKLNTMPDPEGGNEDLRWYYLAPMLWDDSALVDDWLEDICMQDQDGIEDIDDSKGSKGIQTHFDTLKQYYYDIKSGRYQLGKRPSDLVDVLTDMVLASPAVCIQRSISKYSKGQGRQVNLWATEIALAFLSKMDSPESIAAVEASVGRRSDDYHWKNQLEYNKRGNIQAVFDEYAHLLASENGSGESMLESIKNDWIDSMKIKTTSYNVDTYQQFKARVTDEGKPYSTLMRTHYAVAFTKGQGRERDTDRKRIVRNSFNSPFRPFVLASTSIGQEGLDFHNYCRRIVHWNLPSNPIDLEQREGRINRYKCLAIRQNVAKRYGSTTFTKDVWDEMFREAEEKEKKKANGASDLLPFWGLTNDDNMVKIERIVPMYPFSRDEIQYERLIKILSLYRLTLGQARQEELLDYLIKNTEDTNQLKKLFINLSPYYRNKHGTEYED